MVAHSKDLEVCQCASAPEVSSDICAGMRRVFLYPRGCGVDPILNNLKLQENLLVNLVRWSLFDRRRGDVVWVILVVGKNMRQSDGRG